MNKLVQLIIIIFFLQSCGNDTAQQNAEKDATSIEDKKTMIKVPSFSEDSAFQFVKDQVTFGPRVPGTSAHKACAEYIVETLESFGLSVIVQEGSVRTFDGKIFKLKNIIASTQPEAKQRIFYSAHWDTRPFADQDMTERDKPIDGANDGGSGAAVLLEMARNFQQQKPVAAIDLIFWDIEDYGQPADSKFPEMEDSYCLGSQYWANNRDQNIEYRFGVNLDMVGGDRAVFAQETHSLNFASGVVQKVWQQAAASGYGQYFINEINGAIIDDHYYVNEIARIPCIDIIEQDRNTRSNFNKHWHTHKDNLDNISKSTLKAVGQVMLEVAYREK
jgi:glutaminyl-peptide cyclotransferase